MTGLLAKLHVAERPDLSLAQHCCDTEQAALEVFRADGRWGAAWARFFELDEANASRFLLNLRIAGLFHDIGKANEDFQALMLGRTRTPQTLRHEHISALVLSLPSVRAWLGHAPVLDVDVITAAVLSHHLKAADQGDWRWAQPHSDRPIVTLRLGDPQISAIFERVRELAELGPVPSLPTTAWAYDRQPWSDALAEGRRRARDFSRDIRNNQSRQRLLLAVKAGVIVADSVASGVFRVGGSLQRWIDDIVHMPALTANDIASKIIGPRIAQISARTGVPFVPHRFQQLAAQQGRRAMLIAGCGAGKTLAAWNWAESRAREAPLGRVLFLYPTRGTATEGFRDYVAWAPTQEAALLHGAAAYELEAMRENPPESMRGKPEPDERRDRMYALEHWSRRFFSATVDQFLGFMQHIYTGMCLLPVLADSAIIFDEIHSYDRQLFNSLLAFLEHFDVPVLCMTATLPADRRRELERLGFDVFPGPEHRQELADLERQETQPRYRINPATAADAALEHAVAAQRDGRRVLWVVNTVNECLRVAEQLTGVLGVEPLVYHSRFRLCDRKRAHERTIEAFQAGGDPVIAVTTQVCEMSLDLDADMLITEVAPITSLVQRFGRSNRSPTRPPSDRADIYWYVPRKHLPYSPKELQLGQRMLESLGGRDISQRDLAEALLELSPVGRDARATAPFLDGGYYAVRGSLREESEHTVTAVLNRDLDELLALVRERKPYDALLLPVPRKQAFALESRPAALPRHIEVADSRHYSPTRGFGVGTGA